MARSEYLSLEEARNTGKLDRFAKEHPSKGSWKRFDEGLAAMTNGDPAKAARIRRAVRRTSNADASED